MHKQVFASEDDKRRFDRLQQQTPGPLVKQEGEMMAHADRRGYQLFRYFASIEEGLLRVILLALGYASDQQTWKQDYKLLLAEYSVLFSLQDRIDILRGLVKSNVLTDTFGDISLASELSKDMKKVPYLNAVEAAFGYRNILAHEGYKVCIQSDGKSAEYLPIVFVRAHQRRRGYGNVNLLDDDVRDKCNNLVYQSFSEFVYRLSLGLPPGGLVGQRYIIVDQGQDRDAFLNQRRAAIRSQSDALLKRKHKKFDSLLKSFPQNGG